MKTLKTIKVVIYHPNGDKFYTNAEKAYIAFFFFLGKGEKCYIKEIEKNGKESEADLLFHLPTYRQEGKIWGENNPFFQDLEKRNNLQFSL